MRRMKRKYSASILFAVTVLLFSNVSFCQINFEWSKRNDVRLFNRQPNIPKPNSILVDSSGNTYFTSLIIDSNKVKVLLVKYNSTGSLKWSRTYLTNVDGVNGNYGSIVKSDGRNSIYIASRYLDSTTNKILLLKYDSTGNMIWDRRYLNPGSSCDVTGGMDLDKSGFIYVTGYSQDFNTFIKCLTLKYNSNGDLQWARSFQPNSTGTDIVVDEQGNSYIAGTILVGNSSKTYMMAAKYDGSGVLLWTKSYGIDNGGYDEATNVILDDSSNVIVGGYSYYQDWNYTILKYSNSGTLIKYTNYNQGGYDIVSSLATDSRGNIYVTGRSDYSTILIKYDCMLAYRGAVIPTDYSINKVKYAGGKYIYITGSKKYTSPTRTGLYFAKLDTNLSTVYSIDFPMDSALNLVPYSFVIDKNGNILIGAGAEYVPVSPPLNNYYYSFVFKLSPVSGIQNITGNVADKYSLEQNYPNPFNNTSNLKFEIVKSGDVKIVVYDVQGREVQTLVNERLNAGTYLVKFDGSMLTSGVYFYKMVTGEFSETKRMILIK